MGESNDLKKNVGSFREYDKEIQQNGCFILKCIMLIKDLVLYQLYSNFTTMYFIKRMEFEPVFFF